MSAKSGKDRAERLARSRARMREAKLYGTRIKARRRGRQLFRVGDPDWTRPRRIGA